MNLSEKYGQWACVIGAAEGLGAAFAYSLAKRGMNLILVDIKKNQLESTALNLRESFLIKTVEVIEDLSKKNAADVIMEKIAGVDCQFLVYNAAYGPVLPFLSNSESDLDLYLSVNNRTLLMLVYKFIRRTTASRKGILLISSLAGFRGTRLVVPYAATKAFIWNLAEGLHYELKDKGLDISVLCPGTIDTPGFRATKAKATFFTPKPMSPFSVAEIAITKFGRQLFIIPGFSNKFAHFLLQRVLPRKLSSKIHNDTMRDLYQSKS